MKKHHWFGYLFYSGLAAAFGLALVVLPIQLFPTLEHYWHNSNAAVTYQAPEAPKPRGENSARRPVKLLFVGDIMLDRGVAVAIRSAGAGDYQFPFAQIKDTLSAADLTFGNLEGPLSDQGVDRHNLYSFRMKKAAAPALAAAGFDVLSIANNHIGDWGTEAFLDTIQNLEQRGLVVVGGGSNLETASTPKIINVNGLKIGFLGFTDVGPDWLAAGPDRPGILLAVNPDRRQIIAKAKQVSDVLVVSFHWGDEYTEGPTGRVRQLAREAIEAGATLVIGHHPHVIHSPERYGEGLIAYSLGNFVFDQYFSKRTKEGLMLVVEVIKTGLPDLMPITVHLNGTYQPVVAR